MFFICGCERVPVHVFLVATGCHPFCSYFLFFSIFHLFCVYTFRGQRAAKESSEFREQLVRVQSSEDRLGEFRGQVGRVQSSEGNLGESFNHMRIELRSSAPPPPQPPCEPLLTEPLFLRQVLIGLKFTA